MGGRDLRALSPNERATARTTTETAIVVMPGAGRRSPKPGALDEVARLAEDRITRQVKG
ncbi:hypothetical protein [Actinoallomurus sp. NPDC052274]|uniref:hypothetical protein n=1 Tax=Actinoallomurus sp. NPDC052274 TaxID=3155420 RepID=UPI00342F9914